MTPREANAILIRCIRQHLSKGETEARRWLTNMGPTYQAEAMKRVMAGMHTPERLFDTVVPWRLKL